MTREEFLGRYRHELAGIVLDAAMANRHGAELAVFCRSMMQRIDAKLGEMYVELTRPQPSPNGMPAPPKTEAKPR
jgi:hypothetical protein